MIGRYSIQVTSPHDPINAYMGGTDENIPLLDLGEKHTAPVQIGLGVLPPALAAAWLLRLAEAATALAEQVSRERVGSS